MKRIILAILAIAILVYAFYYMNASTTEVARIQDSLVGVWQSTQDPKAVLKIDNGGKYSDWYDNGEMLGEGTWEVYEQEGAEYDPSGIFLSMNVDENIFEYAILEASETTLTLSYLARGNTLNYSRIESVPTESATTVSLGEQETYSNAEYKFTVTHPVTWEVQEALKPQEARAVHEIVTAAKEYGMWRGTVTTRIFPNEKNLSTQEWWSEWLAEEDVKEAECRAEYGDESPCLFLRGLIEWEDESTLAGEEAITVGIFRFDHEEECTYAAHGEYVYGLCAAGSNPNDPDAAENKAITDSIRDSFKFN